MSDSNDVDFKEVLAHGIHVSSCCAAGSTVGAIVGSALGPIGTIVGAKAGAMVGSFIGINSSDGKLTPGKILSGIANSTKY